MGFGTGLVDRLPVLRPVPRLRRDEPPEAGLGRVRGLPGGDHRDDHRSRHGRLGQQRRRRGRRLHHRAGGLRSGAHGRAVPPRGGSGGRWGRPAGAGRPGDAGPAGAGAPGPRSLEERNRETVAEAKSRIERRKDARRLATSNPSLARELKIGRPDLPRDYDDGGLVDVNHVPGPALAAPLGLAPAEVTDVLAARDRLGRFASADELGAYTQLSPDRVDELRDLMLFT